MIGRATTRRLRWHAGLEEVGDEPTPSISACTWPANNLGGQLEPAIADFISTLEIVNRELNGPIPSENPSSDVIPTDVAYSVAEVVRMLRDYAASMGVC